MSLQEFKAYKIGELFDVFSGLSKSRDQFGHGYPFVTFKDVFENYFLPDQLNSLANTNDKERHSCSVKKGDVFLTRTSETQEELGMSSVALQDYENATFNGFTKRLRLKKEANVDIDLKYLGYFLRSPLFRNQVSQHSSLTTRASLNSTSINSLEILLPDISKQSKIGQILKSLDDKIELNRQTAQTLEAIAQAIFKEWFVDFNFPDATGEMQESELGEIPKGWRVMSLKNLGTIITGKTPSSSTPDHFGDHMPFITPTDFKNYGKLIIDADRYVSKKGAAALKNKILTINSVVVTCIGSDMGKVAINKVESITNQQINSIVPNEIATCDYLYYYLCEKYELLRSIASGGSTMPIINKGQFEAIKIVVPATHLLNNFHLKAHSLNELLEKTITENTLLIELRDSLLPKLMKGEITII